MSTSLKNPIWKYSPIHSFTHSLILLVYTGICVYLFGRSTFVSDGMTWVGLGLFPYLLIIPDKQAVSWRYGWVVVLLLVLSVWLQIRTLKFAVLAVSVLFTIEGLLGKTTILPLLLMGVLSPVFRYVSEVFSFPIRLQLSEWAGKLLQGAGMPVEIVGNVVRLNGVEFAVDTACMGLEMTEVTILIALFLLGFYTRKTRRILSVVWVGLFLVAAFLLNTFSNLMRMLILIVFHIFPEQPAHDLTGILCLVVYVVVPLFFLSKYLFSVLRFGKNMPDATPIANLPVSQFKTIGKNVVHLLLLGIVVAHIFIHTKANIPTHVQLPMQIEGMTRTQRLYDIVQFSNEQMLVYFKPLSAFYEVGHNPMICWRGGGWQFKQITTQVIGGREVYTGILQKDTERIYTAWWFDNGTTQTIRQLDWRWEMMRGGKNFCLVNVSVNKPEELAAAATWLMQQQVLRSESQTDGLARDGVVWFPLRMWMPCM